jgi:hypothetical protein
MMDSLTLRKEYETKRSEEKRRINGYTHKEKAHCNRNRYSTYLTYSDCHYAL